MSTSNDVTEALRRTIGAMQGELERSVLSSQLLEQSTATLKSTSIQHDTLTFVMDTSKQLITALEKADWLDRLLVLAALTFFMLVVLFILKQRILDRGVRIAFWWTRFLPNFNGDEKLLMEQEEGYATMSTIAETVLSSVVSTATSSDIPSATSNSIVESIAETVSDFETLSDVLSSSLPTVTETVIEHLEL